MFNRNLIKWVLKNHIETAAGPCKTSKKMSNTIKIEKFNGKNSFNLWRIKMRALLKEQRVWAPLSGQPTNLNKEDLAEQEEKAHSLILLSLSDEVLYEVVEEQTAAGLWLKLEKLYMTKSICNKLLLKRHLFGL